MKTLPYKFALYSMLLSLLAVCLFHIAVIAGWIPYEIVWGGKFRSREEAIPFEVVSVIINAIMIWILLQRTTFVATLISFKWIRILTWCMALLFALNTLGNLFSENEFEKLVFSPLTALFSILCARIALEPGNS